MQEGLGRIQVQMRSQSGGYWMHQRTQKHGQETTTSHWLSEHTSHGAAVRTARLNKPRRLKLVPEKQTSAFKTQQQITDELKYAAHIHFLKTKSWTFCCTGVTPPPSGHRVVVMSSWVKRFCTFAIRLCFSNDKNEPQINLRRLTTSQHNYAPNPDVL